MTHTPEYIRQVAIRIMMQEMLAKQREEIARIKHDVAELRTLKELSDVEFHRTM